MKIRHAHQDWQKVAERLAFRLAALQEAAGGSPGTAEEICTRTYQMVDQFARRGDGEEECLLRKTWVPGKGAPLYYGELTDAHLANIIDWLKAQITKEGFEAFFMQRRTCRYSPLVRTYSPKWSPLLEEMLAVLELRTRRTRDGRG